MIFVEIKLAIVCQIAFPDAFNLLYFQNDRIYHVKTIIVKLTTTSEFRLPTAKVNKL